MCGRHHVLRGDDREEWLRYYRRAGEPGAYHHPDYLSMLAGNYEFDREHAEAFVYEAGEDVVYYPYLRRPLETSPLDAETVNLAGYSDIVSSWYYGGPFHSDGADESISEAFTKAFGSYCAEEGIVAEFVRFDPNEGNHETFDALEPTFNRETVPVDLHGTAEDVWERYEDRNRRAIKQARETALVVEHSAERTDLEAFHDIYTNAMDARDAAPHYRFDLSFFETLVDSSLFSLFVARHDGAIVGGFIAAHDDRRGYHYLSASNPDYWDMRVNNLLYHEVVLHMQEAGREVFDFQGGRPGVFKFKRGFSPDRGEFYVGKRIHDRTAYDRFVDAAAERGVDTDSGYFPAYRVEQSN